MFQKMELDVDTEFVKNEAEKVLNAAKNMCKLKPDILKNQAKHDLKKLTNLQEKYIESFGILQKSHRILFKVCNV